MNRSTGTSNSNSTSTSEYVQVQEVHDLFGKFFFFGKKFGKKNFNKTDRLANE